MISFPLDIYPEVDLLGRRVVLFLTFRETSVLFSIMAIHKFTVPPEVHMGFFFSTSLPVLVISCL